jgi:hypothetical protein
MLLMYTNTTPKDGVFPADVFFGSVVPSAFSGTVDIVDIYIHLNIDNIDPFHR